MNMLFDSNIKIILCDVLSLICREKVTYSSKQKGFITGKETLNKENFDEFIDIIRKINSIEYNSKMSENPGGIPIIKELYNDLLEYKNIQSARKTEKVCRKSLRISFYLIGNSRLMN